MQTTFNVKLGGLAPNAVDDQVDQMWKISRKAQQIVQRELERRLYVAHGVAPIHGLPTMVGGSDPDEFRKNGAWSVTVQMAADTPTETLAELRDLIVNAHKEAAGKSGVSVTFEGAVSRVERFF